MNKIQLLAYLTIGNLFAALLWNFPVKAWNLEDLTGSVRDEINSLAAGSSQAQTPLDVPRMEAPIGNQGNGQASIQPCAAPPLQAPMAAVPTPEPVPSSIGKSPEPVTNGAKRFNDRKAKVLMNLAPGNQIASVYRRLHSPDSTDLTPPGGGIIDYYSTTDGLIAVNHSSGVITSIGFVQL